MPALGKIESVSRARVVHLIDQEKLSRRLGENIGKYISHIAQSLNTSIYTMRKSSERLGVFRSDSRKEISRIAVRWDLENELLLLVLCHELGHAMVWRMYGRKALPHGKEWKFAVQQILRPAIEMYSFSGNWGRYAQQLALNPKATYKDNLANIVGANMVRLKEIELNSIFIYKNNAYKKGPLRRTRYLCQSCTNRRQYAFDPNVAVSKE